MMISSGDPAQRLFHLKRSNLTFSVKEQMLERKTDDCIAYHWIYLCKKNAGFKTAE